MPPALRPYRFLIPLLAIFALLTIAIGVDLAVLWRADELHPLDVITQHEYRARTLYDGLSIGFADYKYAAYRRPTPDIVAIGTSRAMQIRQSFFLKPFYNLGGLVNGAVQANVLADRLLLRAPRPKIVIFVLDFWTFCRPGNISGPDLPENSATHDGMGRPDPYFLIYRLLFEDRYSVGDFARLLFSSSRADDEKRIGIGAKLGNGGFAADGSNYGNPYIDVPLADRWRGTEERVAAGTGQFLHDCKVSELSLAALRRFVGRMDAAGIATVLIMAPVPGVTLDRMQANGRFGYIDAVRGILAQAYPTRFFDDFDMRQTSPDTEFLDGFHGGEITYMRMILAAAAPESSPLHGLVDTGKLEERIRDGTGRTFDSHNSIYGEFFHQ